MGKTCIESLQSCTTLLRWCYLAPSPAQLTTRSNLPWSQTIHRSESWFDCFLSISVTWRLFRLSTLVWVTLPPAERATSCNLPSDWIYNIKWWLISILPLAGTFSYLFLWKSVSGMRGRSLCQFERCGNIFLKKRFFISFDGFPWFCTMLKLLLR